MIAHTNSWYYLGFETNTYLSLQSVVPSHLWLDKIQCLFLHWNRSGKSQGQLNSSLPPLGQSDQKSHFSEEWKQDPSEQCMSHLTWITVLSLFLFSETRERYFWPTYLNIIRVKNFLFTQFCTIIKYNFWWSRIIQSFCSSFSYSFTRK